MVTVADASSQDGVPPSSIVVRSESCVPVSAIDRLLPVQLMTLVSGKSPVDTVGKAEMLIPRVGSSRPFATMLGK